MMLFVKIILPFIFNFTNIESKPKNWFEVTKITSDTYIINEPKSPQNNSCYLIVGEKEAVLFDSGTGLNKPKDGSISYVIRSITNLPVTLVLSHLHYDHTGNVKEFSAIALPQLSVFEDRITADSILNLTKKEVLSNAPSFLKISKRLPIGKEIDLGNRIIKILSTPGHTDESISIIDNRNKIIFTGDFIYNDILLVDNCEEYIASITEVMNSYDSKYRLFGAHGKPEVEYNKLIKIKEALICYTNSKCKAGFKINLFNLHFYKKEDQSFVIKYTSLSIFK